MKLTPEQKSILAYGETRGILKERKSLMRFTEGSGECSDYNGEPRMMYGVEEAIRDAWQKRAARRAWNPPEGRTCGNCENGYNYHRSSPCWKCLRNAAAEHYQFLLLQDNWEPRKEASND